MAFPRTEAEVISLFKLASTRLGWQIVHLQTAFPDAVIENGRGQRLIIEFEFESRNFRAHGHDPAGCDLIVCYEDSWENPPVPVWTIEEYTKEEVGIIRQLLRGKISIGELVEEQRRYNSLWDEFSKAKMKILEVEHKLVLEKLKREHEGKLASIAPTSISETKRDFVPETKTDWIIPVCYAILGYSFVIVLPCAIELIRYLIR